MPRSSSSASRLLRLSMLSLTAALGCAATSQAAVLYDQTTPVGTYESYSDAYPSSPACDSQAADDFTVPAGQSWTIARADVVGTIHPYLGTAPPSVVNTFIYSNAGTLPGAELFRQLGISASGQPNYSIPLTGTPALTTGTYWLSVEQAEAGCMVPSWGWVSRASKSGNTSAYRDPSGFYNPNCKDWQPVTTCYPGWDPDLLFALGGTATSASVSFGSLQRNIKRGTAQLTVNAPGPGTLDVTGQGVGAQISTATPIGSAGPVAVAIRAKGKARKRLTSRGRVRLTLTVSYTSPGATPSSTQTKVKLRKRSKRK